MRYALFVIGCVFGLTVALNATASTKVDDVFLDEGEGDFDVLPVAPSSVPVKAAPAPQKAVESRQEASQIVPPPAPPPVAEPEEIKSLPVKPSRVEASKPAPKPVAAPKSVQKPEKKSRRPASESHEPLKAGVYLRTKEACPMLRQPASDSAEMLTVKPARRLWVEEVDESWVRAFNKAGEPGYIERDCFE